jgi:YrbI family 3-deoxy-D-manno-octulosonate 8-phosphate phosphatase
MNGLAADDLRPPAAWPDPAALHTIMFDFDGVFTDNAVYVFQDGREAVRCDRADGLGIDWLRHYAASRATPLTMLVLSTERNTLVSARAKKLKLPCAQAVGDKLEYVLAYWARERPSDADPFRGLLYAGNDVNDLDVMRRAGFSVAPADADARVRAVASAVLPQTGGHGFVRALVERLLGVDRLSKEGLDGTHAHR